MVLHHVSHDPVLVEVRRRRAAGLLERDLHARDVFAIPNRRQHPVRESHHQQVIDHLLPQVPIDPKQVPLAPPRPERRVQRRRGRRVVPERLLEHQPRPPRSRSTLLRDGV
eukprot:31055-Pelagococcus_subviridis.AAC.5